jgi:predicted phosphatase
MKIIISVKNVFNILYVTIYKMSDIKKIKRMLSKKKKIVCNRSYGNNSKSWKCDKCNQVFSYFHQFKHDCENYKMKKYKNLIKDIKTKN